MTDFKHKFYAIADFIKIVQNKQDRLDKYDPDYLYSVYGKYASDDDFDVNSQIYIGDTPDFDDDDNEVYPKEATDLGLSLLYSCDHFQDVVDLAYKQKPKASIEEVVGCLNFYAERDDFLDLQ